MEQFRFTEESVPFANSVVDRVAKLMIQPESVEGALESGRSLASMSTELRETARLDDVFDNIWLLTLLGARSVEDRTRIPVVTFPRIGPIPILEWPWPSPFLPRGSFYTEFVRHMYSESGLEMLEFNREEMVDAVSKPLSRFIALRVEAQKWARRILRQEEQTSAESSSSGGLGVGPSPSGIGGNGNYHIKLTSQKHGWRAKASPAYVMRFTYFGAPTYPVFGYLPGGYWIFGGDNAFHSNLVVDPTVFDIPTTLTPCVTAF